MTRACRPRLLAALLLASLLSGRAAHALRILITNDDGFEASTLHALYRTLKNAGHEVIIVSETQDNSGRGGAVDVFKPIGTLQQDTRGGAVKAGAPGIGTLPTDASVYYVDGTPVAAALYGIDIAAPRRWHAPPDLAISGPNYGNNTGLVNNLSGTVNAALICLNRGIPAIAVSTATPARYKPFGELEAADPEYEVAAIVARLVRVLDARSARSFAPGPAARFARDQRRRPLLPLGLGLNVNVPAFAAGTARRLPVRISHEGSAASAIPIFVDDLSQDAAAAALGLRNLPPLPGVSLILPNMPPGSHGVVTDGDPLSEQHVIDRGAVAISVIQGNHDVGAARARTLAPLLQQLSTRR